MLEEGITSYMINYLFVCTFQPRLCYNYDYFARVQSLLNLFYMIVPMLRAQMQWVPEERCQFKSVIQQCPSAAHQEFKHAVFDSISQLRMLKNNLKNPCSGSLILSANLISPFFQRTVHWMSFAKREIRIGLTKQMYLLIDFNQSSSSNRKTII